MEKKYIVLLVLVCGILGGGLFAIRGTMDRVAPEIHFPEEQKTYDLSFTKEDLLRDVTAVDDKDGDVTDSLIVENVFTDDVKGSASVVYVAKDSSNNVTKKTREMIWNAEQVQTEAETEQDTEAETEKTEPKTEEQTEMNSEAMSETEEETEAVSETEEMTENSVPVAELMNQNLTEEEEETETEQSEHTEADETERQTEAETAVPVPVVDYPEEDLDAYYEEIFAGLSSEAPRLRLTNRRLAIAVGDSFDPMLYVESIVDNYDNKYELFRQVSIEGEVNTNIPGIYQLIYTATDSSGNMSNRAMLLVDVQGTYEE